MASGDSLPITDNVSRWTRRRPGRVMDWRGDFLTPIAWVIAFGVLVSMAVYAFYPDPSTALRAGVAVAFIVALWFMLGLRNVMHEFEEIVSDVFDQDDVPPQETTKLIVNIGEREQRRVDFPVAPDTLVSVAEHLHGGGDFTVRELTGSGRPLSRDSFTAMRRTLFRLGWLRWQDENAHQQGVEVTALGAQGFARLAAGEVQAENVLGMVVRGKV